MFAVVHFVLLFCYEGVTLAAVNSAPYLYRVSKMKYSRTYRVIVCINSKLGNQYSYVYADSSEVAGASQSVN